MRFIRVLAAGLLMGVTAAHAAKSDLELIGQQGDAQFMAVSAPWAQDRQYLENTLRNACFNRTHCFVHIWDKKTGGARKIPFTDQQMANMLAMYRQNKHTRLSELYFNCKKFKDVPKDQCL